MEDFPQTDGTTTSHRESQDINDNRHWSTNFDHNFEIKDECKIETNQESYNMYHCGQLESQDMINTMHTNYATTETEDNCSVLQNIVDSEVASGIYETGMDLEQETIQKYNDIQLLQEKAKSLRAEIEEKQRSLERSKVELLTEQDNYDDVQKKLNDEVQLITEIGLHQEALNTQTKHLLEQELKVNQVLENNNVDFSIVKILREKIIQWYEQKDDNFNTVIDTIIPNMKKEIEKKKSILIEENHNREEQLNKKTKTKQKKIDILLKNSETSNKITEASKRCKDLSLALEHPYHEQKVMEVKKNLDSKKSVLIEQFEGLKEQVRNNTDDLENQTYILSSELEALEIKINKGNSEIESLLKIVDDKSCDPYLVKELQKSMFISDLNKQELVTLKNVAKSLDEKLRTITQAVTNSLKDKESTTYSQKSTVKSGSMCPPKKKKEQKKATAVGDDSSSSGISIQDNDTTWNKEILMKQQKKQNTKTPIPHSMRSQVSQEGNLSATTSAADGMKFGETPVTAAALKNVPTGTIPKRKTSRTKPKNHQRR